MRKLNRQQEIIKCECGCGGELEKYDFQWRIRKFISGHNSKISPPRPRVNFKQICNCGCGEETNYGMKYVHGHYFRMNNPMNDPVCRLKHLEKMKTAEEREKRSVANKGRIVSNITREKLRNLLTGRDAYWMKGEKNVMNNPEIRERCRLRAIESRTPEVVAKIKSTMIERYGVDNYSKSDKFKNLIRLENHPNWKGGISGERALYYSRVEWKEIAKSVWKRDSGTCQRCHMHQSEKEKVFNIHHIIGFEVSEMRGTLTNLVLLCRECHSFVHSKKNNGEYRSIIQT